MRALFLAPIGSATAKAVAIMATLLLALILPVRSLAQNASEGQFRILVAEGQSSALASNILNDLPSFISGEIVPDPNGTFSVYAGSFATRAEADQMDTRLRNEVGVITVGVRELPSAGTTTTVPAGGVQFRVVVAESPNRSVAESLQGSLVTNPDFAGAQVMEHEGAFLVIVGQAFGTRPEAETLRLQLESAGYYSSEVREFDASFGTGSGLSQVDRERVAALEQQLHQALREHRFPSARTIADTIGGIDPSYPVRARRQEIADAEVAYEEELRRKEFEDLENKRGAVEEQITAKNYAQARVYLEELEVSARRNPARFEEFVSYANLTHARISDLIRTEGVQTSVEAGSGLNPVLIGVIGGVVVLAILGVLAFVMLGKRKKASQPAPRPAMLQTTSTLVTDPLAQAPTPAPVAPAPAAPKKPAQPKKGAPQPSPAMPMLTSPDDPTEPGPSFVTVGDHERIRPGSMAPAPKGGKAPAKQEAPIQADTVPLVFRDETPPPPRQPAVAARESDSDTSLKLDFLMEQPPASTGETTAPGVASRGGAAQEPSRASAEFAVPPLPDPVAASTAADRTTPSSGIVAKLQHDPDVFYEQSFDDEAIGKPPANWRNNYDYATLQIANGRDNSHALRFEKKEGVGSAYYCCKFPEARGRIGVEFDIRCDDKNKYLLGFYIEKDEDFRQSISTIIHRTTSSAQPTLRLQNEPTPYEFGQWKHVRYEIDLQRQILDGYVDDQAVALGVRVANCPKSVNTLSIRDNLATTGILMLDNIRIYRVR